MKNNEKKIIGLLSIMLIIIFGCTFILVDNKNIFNTYTYAGFFLVINLVSIFLLGIFKNKSFNKLDVIQLVVIYCITFLILKYVGGILFGFVHNPYNLSFIKILGNVLPMLFLIILEEFFRYLLVSKTNENKIILFFITTTMSLFQILTGMLGYSFSSGLEIFSFIGELVLPVVATNFLLTFVAMKTDYLPAIIYRVILELYIFLIPIIPDFGIYIGALLEIIFPTIFFLRINTLFAKRNFTKAKNKTSLIKNVGYVIITSILLCIICLTSGFFNYYAMAIGSDSMVPTFKKGDVVIIDKITNDFENIKINDVLVHKHDNKYIVHRIVDIRIVDNKYVYYTKGDNNDSKDNYPITQSDAVGIVKYIVPYVGYPSVWLSEALG